MSSFNRLLSRREKPEPKDHAGPLNGVFVADEKLKKTSKDEEPKIKSIQERLSRKGISVFKDSDVTFAIATPYAKGDKDKAYELLSLVADSEQGAIYPYKLEVKLLGAVNRESVTCWLDSLLFAMFARLGSFEAMLFQKFDDVQKKRLATLLRLWVNILRAGKLITVDITRQIQLQLANCGWKEAAQLCQHDASEAFSFITETLSLPLLTLKMDIFHTGKEDKDDDHKFINERLLELAIPDETQECQTVTLEDCLEMFFNNKIEVKRYLDALERRTTLSSIKTKSSFDSMKPQAYHIDVAEVGTSQPASPMTPSVPIPTSPVRPSLQRRRAPSIIQEYYLDEKRGLHNTESGSRAGRTRKEVMMPAWQFFQLIPWYTDRTPANDAQVAAHFSSTRPVLGICLKRYGMLPNGTAFKKKTHVDIPLEIGLPHFISDDDMSDAAPAFGNFKLSLQSFVCHEGRSVDTGHYVSFVRTPDPDSQGQDQWMRFDDLAKERVIEVAIEERLQRESPYLLFYQVVPIGDAKKSPDEQEPAYADAPPSYAESNASKTSKPKESSTGDSSTVMSSEEGAAQRFSTETSISEEERGGRGSLSVERKTEPSNATVASSAPSIEIARARSNDNPPVSNTKSEPEVPGDSSTDPLASRRGSNISKTSNKSRPTSSSGDKLFSASLTKLTKRMSGDKLRSIPPNDTSSDVPINTTTIPEIDHTDDQHKLKKDGKERNRLGLKEHHLLSRTKKPDRECVLM